MKKGDANDPKGLIFEAYRMEGISGEECRTIFLDWALSLPADHDTKPDVEALLARYGRDAPDHPMTQVLSQARDALAKPRRRGGWRARRQVP